MAINWTVCTVQIEKTIHMKTWLAKRIRNLITQRNNLLQIFTISSTNKGKKARKILDISSFFISRKVEVSPLRAFPGAMQVINMQMRRVKRRENGTSDMHTRIHSNQHRISASRLRTNYSSWHLSFTVCVTVLSFSIGISCLQKIGIKGAYVKKRKLSGKFRNSPR